MFGTSTVTCCDFAVFIKLFIHTLNTASFLNHTIQKKIFDTMLLTNILFKKAKSKLIMVSARSVISDHMLIRIRERVGEKLEFIAFDPYIQRKALYREAKKIRSLK
ncbi:39S ribosomal protein L33, mitochondrial [Harpegnathos saltator]|uniref:39S ribosomal protein L33, mitochondrial n=1 Tax=Harpegnathos saltator TaxID=610380 RepID=UPI00058DC6F2|nr:39S ribosomal protein L33, mitochondrial [Harpegnathos saltator]